MTKAILIADSRKLLCDYWGRILEASNHRTAACWTTINEVLHRVREGKPDLLLIGHDFANGRGFEAARQAMILHPALRCIMVLPAGMTHYPEAIQNDISGYLPDDLDDPSEVLRCIERISQGYRYISEVFWGALRSPSDHTAQQIAGLSERRKQLLRLVAGGLTSRQIAREMGIVEATVRHHKEEVSKLLGLDGVYQLKSFAGSVAYLLE